MGYLSCQDTTPRDTLLGISTTSVWQSIESMVLTTQVDCAEHTTHTGAQNLGDETHTPCTFVKPDRSRTPEAPPQPNGQGPLSPAVLRPRSESVILVARVTNQ